MINIRALRLLHNTATATSAYLGQTTRGPGISVSLSTKPSKMASNTACYRRILIGPLK